MLYMPTHLDTKPLAASPATFKTLFPMDFHEFDNVKAEKAQAMRRFRRHRNFRFTVILAILFSTSFLSPWIPSIGDFFRRFSLLLHQPSFMFFLLNATITAIFISSGQKSDQVELVDLCAENVSSVVANAVEASAPATDLTSAMETVEDSKSTVIRDEVATVKECPPLAAVHTVSEEIEEKIITEEKIIPEIESENRENSQQGIQREAAEMEMVIAEMPEKNFAPVIQPEPGESEMVMVAPAANPMDELSNEEFRLRIETFIAASKRTLYQENMAEARVESERCRFMP